MWRVRYRRAMDVEDVIARLRADGNVGRAWYEAYEDPKPLDVELRAPDGTTLPWELRAWLAYDATWLPLLERSEGTAPRLAGEPVRAILERWARETLGGDELEVEGERFTVAGLVEVWLGQLEGPSVADAHAIELPPSGSQEHLLIVRSEGPSAVIGCHRRFELWWKYPSFGAFLAHYFGYASPG